VQNLFGSEPYSGRSSSVKPLCSKTELKSCTTVIIVIVIMCVFPDGFHVQSIQPLETLHNALTLRQVEHFIKNVTDMHCRTAPLCITPSTPPQSHQPTQLSLHAARLSVPSVSQPRGGTLIQSFCFHCMALFCSRSIVTCVRKKTR